MIIRNTPETNGHASAASALPASAGFVYGTADGGY
jgi:hypothetical protein